MYKNREDKNPLYFFYFNVHKTIDKYIFMYYNIITLKERKNNMVHSITLQQEIEKWWKHLDKVMTVAESLDDIKIGDCTFRPWGDKHHYNMKTKCTSTYLRTFQSTEPVENTKGEIVYPILDVYIDICKGRKYTSYKKVRCHCSC